MNRDACHVTGHTAYYAVLGHPITHTLSPVMQQAALNQMGMDARYLAFDVSPGNLPSVMQGMHAMGFRGVNLTVPLKETAFRSLPALDGNAARLGAVNTLVRTGNGWRGHNTDGEGFLAALREEFGCDASGRSVLVYGTGGAGRAVALSCAVNGARRLMLADIDGLRARKVAREIRQAAPAADVKCIEPDGKHLPAAVSEAELIVQATPVGMKSSDPSALDAGGFRKEQCLYDLIYMFPETATMRAAATAGARVANGLGMLLHQGALALRMWTGIAPPLEVMRRALKLAVYGASRPE